jgi:hypothetical protein
MISGEDTRSGEEPPTPEPKERSEPDRIPDGLTVVVVVVVVVVVTSCGRMAAPSDPITNPMGKSATCRTKSEKGLKLVSIIAQFFKQKWT